MATPLNKSLRQRQGWKEQHFEPGTREAGEPVGPRTVQRVQNGEGASAQKAQTRVMVWTIFFLARVWFLEVFKVSKHPFHPQSTWNLTFGTRSLLKAQFCLNQGETPSNVRFLSPSRVFGSRPGQRSGRGDVLQAQSIGSSKRGTQVSGDLVTF